MGPGSALKGRPGTTAEFFRILLGRSVPWLIAGGFALAAAVGAEAQTARTVEHFNYVLGTQTFGPSYHFTAAPSVVETAGAIAALGSNTIKFQLKPTAGRVGMWRGGGRPGMSVSASFVWRCLSGSAIAPFPHPSHRTQRADFPHCALGQDFTPSSTARRVQAGSDARARRSRRGARVDSCRPCFVWSCA